LEASLRAWDIECSNLNMALKPTPFAPGPMNRKDPLPALKEL
jgi:hypothetical protein